MIHYDSVMSIVIGVISTQLSDYLYVELPLTYPSTNAVLNFS